MTFLEKVFYAAYFLWVWEVKLRWSGLFRPYLSKGRNFAELAISGAATWEHDHWTKEQWDAAIKKSLPTVQRP
jgi:hypothetical protein